MLLVSLAAAAAPVPNFTDYEHARAAMTWHFQSFQEEHRFEGEFQVTVPDTFSFVYQDEGQTHRVTEYRGISAVQTQRGRVEYQYQPSQFFAAYQELFVPLMYLLDLPGEWISPSAIVGRTVHRYQTWTDPPVVYWLDEHSGVPLRIMYQEGAEYLTVQRYQATQQGRDQSLTTVGLAVATADWEGTMELRPFGSQWFPAEIVIRDDQATLTITFSEWEVLSEPLEFEVLAALVDALEQGERAYQNEDWEAVIAKFKDILRLDPYCVTGYFYLAYSYGMMGNYLGAVENYQQWLMLEPDTPLALNNLAFTYMLQGVYLDQALKMARRAVELETHPAYLDTLGYGYFLLNELDNALQTLYAALDVADGMIVLEIYKHLGLVYEALGDTEQAQYYLQRREELQEPPA